VARVTKFSTVLGTVYEGGSQEKGFQFQKSRFQKRKFDSRMFSHDDTSVTTWAWNGECTLPNMPMTMRPTDSPPMEISKYTLWVMTGPLAGGAASAGEDRRKRVANTPRARRERNPRRTAIDLDS